MKFNVHGGNTRYSLNFHSLASNFALYQKSTHYTSVKVINSVPSYIKKRQHEVNEFKWFVRNVLYCKIFNMLEEYFYYNKSKVSN
jgi:hypothetical protein